MIRIFTPEGTLIVEVDDPGVKVTIERDGGIVISGAGLQEVRLKPGSYKVHAVKNDKPVRLDQELITITRGDKQVVRVRREGQVTAGPGLLASRAKRFRWCSWAAGASTPSGSSTRWLTRCKTQENGDTIEIECNEPFVGVPSRSATRPSPSGPGPGFRPRSSGERRILPTRKSSAPDQSALLPPWKDWNFRCQTSRERAKARTHYHLPR